MKANQPSPPYRLIRSWNLMNGRISLFALFLLFLFTGTIAFLGTRQLRARTVADAPPLTQAEIAAFVQRSAPRGPEGEAQIFVAPGREHRGKPFPFEIDGEDIGSRDIGRRLQHLDEGAESTHFKGLFQLRKAWRETGLKAQYFREAEESLIASLEVDPERASAWNNLAVVYLTWAKQLDRPRLYLDAYAASHAALSVDSDLPEARFNQAFALEKLGLFQQAAAALEQPWPAAAELDDVEARRTRLEILDPVTLQLDFVRDLENAADKRDRKEFLEIASRFPPAAGRWVEEKLLPRWAEAVEVSGAEAAEPWLAVARDLGALLAAPPKSEILGDQMLVETVMAIDRALASRDQSRFKNLVRGHHAFGLGMASFPEDAVTAEQFFEESAAALHAGISPFEHWATFHLGACRHLRRHLPSAMEIFDGLAAASKKYPRLGLRVGWGRAMIFNQLDQLRFALEVYASAGAIALKLGDVASVSALAYQQAEAEFALDRLDEAWRFLVTALRAADFPILARYRVNILFTAAEQIQIEQSHPSQTYMPRMTEGLAAIQLLFQRQAVENAERSGSPTFEIQNRGRLAAILRSLPGKEDEAGAELRKARLQIANITDSKQRSRQLAELAWTHTVGRQDDPFSDSELELALLSFRQENLHFREIQIALTLAERQSPFGFEQKAGVAG